MTEVAVEALHDLVLEYVCEFEDLRRALSTWNVTGPNDEWIVVLADLKKIEIERPPPQTSPILQENRRKQLGKRDLED